MVGPRSAAWSLLTSPHCWTEVRDGGAVRERFLRLARCNAERPRRASTPWLRSLPIIILTSSDLPRDRVLCMDLGATMYLVKPSDFFGYLQLCKSISEYLMASTGGGVNGPLQAQPRR